MKCVCCSWYLGSMFVRQTITPALKSKSSCVVFQLTVLSRRVRPSPAMQSIQFGMTSLSSRSDSSHLLLLTTRLKQYSSREQDLVISELRGITFLMGSHSVTYRQTQVNTPRLNPSQIYLSRRDGRLSWSKWLVTWWFTRPRTVTHPSANPAAHGWESHSRPVDHMSDALTIIQLLLLLLLLLGVLCLFVPCLFVPFMRPNITYFISVSPFFRHTCPNF